MKYFRLDDFTKVIGVPEGGELEDYFPWQTATVPPIHLAGEASSLGLAPGEWPEEIKVQGHLFVRSKQSFREMGYVYTSETMSLTIAILNTELPTNPLVYSPEDSNNE